MIRMTWLVLAALLVPLLPGVARAGGFQDLNAGLAAQNRGDLETAIQLYTRALESGELTPENQAVAYNNRGKAYADRRDYDAAVRDFSAALQLDPMLAEAYANRGTVHDLKGDYDTALRDYDAALGVAPNNADIYYARGVTHAHKGDPNAALRDYDVALRLNPNLADAYYRRALIYDEQGDLRAAIDDFDAALRLSPNNPWAYYHRGRVYVRKNDNSSALRDFDAALRIDSESPLVVYIRGITLFATGRFADAARDFAHASQLPVQDTYTIVWLHLSRARAGQADVEELADNIKRVDPQSQQPWGRHIVAFFLRQLSADQLLEAAEHPDATMRRTQRCAAVFFVGEQEILDRAIAQARQHLQEAVDLCPSDRVESVVAKAELARLAK